MTTTVYPLTLPGPTGLSDKANERRVLHGPDQEGLSARTFQRDRVSVRPCSFEYSETQAQTFVRWYRSGISNGGAWFQAAWPKPSGWAAAVYRFLGEPKWAHQGNGKWVVTATVEARGTGVLPCPDPYRSNVVLLMRMNTDFVDLRGHATSAYGGAAVTGGAAVFDGGNDFASTNAFSTDFMFDADDFTVEAFIKPTGAGTYHLASVWLVPNYATPSNNVWRLGAGDNCLFFHFRATDAYEYHFTTPANLVAGVDQHVSASRRGQDFILTINGVPQSTTLERSNTGSYTPYSGPIPPALWGTGSLAATLPHLDIGRAQDTGDFVSGGTLYYAGSMHDLRITRGAARYTDEFDPPSFPLPFCTPNGDPYWYLVVLRMGFESGAFIDESPAANVVTAVGSAAITTVAPLVGTRSLVVDGTGAHLHINSTPNFGFGTSPWSLEARVKPVAFSGSDSDNLPVFDFRTSITQDGALFIMGGTHMLAYWNGTTLSTNTSGTAMSAGTAYNVALCYDGTKLYGFVDGIKQFEDTRSIDFGSARELRIGVNAYLADALDQANAVMDSILVTRVCKYTSNY